MEIKERVGNLEKCLTTLILTVDKLASLLDIQSKTVEVMLKNDIY